jgi:hypothetical protein
MFLRGLKEKSNRDFTNKLLDARSSSVSAKKIQTIAVVLSDAEFHDAEAFRSLFKELGLRSPKNTVVFYTEDEDGQKAQWETYFNKKDFGWSGKIKSKDLQFFLEEPFDVLIGYYNKRIPEIEQIIAMSNANLKIGINNDDHRLFDLILELSVIRFDVFKAELKKYLTILNKL